MKIDDFINKLHLDRYPNAIQIFREIPSDSIDTGITSPPYWGLRDYGPETIKIWGGIPNCEHEWIESEKVYHEPHHGEGSGKNFHGQSKPLKPFSDLKYSNHICIKCGAWRGSLGLEPHPQLYIQHLAEICLEVKRILKLGGSFWLNLADTYYGSGKGIWKGHEGEAKEVYSLPKEAKPKQSHRSNWLQPKQLLGIPWRVAIALQEDRWILRNAVIWYKPNGMPSSAKDRLTNSYEFVFHFVKSNETILWRNADTKEWVKEEPTQFYIHDTTGERRTTRPDREVTTDHDWFDWSDKEYIKPIFYILWDGYSYYYDLDAIREPYKPLDRWGGPVMKVPNEYKTDDDEKQPYAVQPRERLLQPNPLGKNPRDVWTINTKPFKGAHFAVFPEALVETPMKATCPENGIVLDPFMGSGTTAVVAKRLNRNWIGIDVVLNYCQIAKERIGNTEIVEWKEDKPIEQVVEISREKPPTPKVELSTPEIKPKTINIGTCSYDGECRYRNDEKNCTSKKIKNCRYRVNE